MKTKIAVLGVGRWGINLLRNFLEHPDALLVAVVDRNPERLAVCQEQFNLDTRVLLATDWDAIHRSIEIEAVAIATPASTHYSLIADALRQGYHVLAEKPLTLDVAECLELCHLAEQQQRQLIVDHTYLFHPAVERGKEVVQSGRLGELRYGYATRTHLGPIRHDVDALWDLAIHDITIFNTWLGQLPMKVQTTGRTWLQRGNGEENPLSLPNGLADFVQVTLTYPTGFQAWIHLCWLNPDKQRRLGVVGTRGTLIFDEMHSLTPLILHHGHLEYNGDRFTPRNQYCEVLDIEATEPLRVVCDRFLRMIHSSQPSPSSSGWVGAQLVQILSCVSQSLQQGGQPVVVPQLIEPHD